MILLKDLSFRYPKDNGLPLIQSVDLRLPAASCSVLRAPSGAGKTTFFKLLSGLLSPTKGEIYLKGMRVDQWRPNQWSDFRRQKIGMIFQFHHLLSGLTALENVALPLMLLGHHRQQALLSGRKWLEALQLSAHANLMPDMLSGGECQRIAIARGLIHQPEIVLADEPTAHLDKETAHLSMSLLKQTVHQNQMTLILATHDENLNFGQQSNLSLQDRKLVTLPGKSDCSG